MNITYKKSTKEYTDDLGIVLNPKLTRDSIKKSARAKARRVLKSAPTLPEYPAPTPDQVIRKDYSNMYGKLFFNRKICYTNKPSGVYSTRKDGKFPGAPTQELQEARNYIFNLLTELSAEYLVPLTLAIRNQNSTYQNSKYNFATGLTEYKLVFGYKLLSWKMHDGYTEYNNVERSLRRTAQDWIIGTTGMEAVHWIVIHEFTHILQTSQASKVDAHGGLFQLLFSKMINEHPYQG